MDKNQKLLISALATEVQAISIYEMELKIFTFFSFIPKRKLIKGHIEGILLEEKQHAFHIFKYIPDYKPSKIKIFLLIFSGLLLGLVFSLLPLKLYLYFHVIAEKQASETYVKTKLALISPEKSLVRELDTAIHQEMEHSNRFKILLDEIFS